MKQLLDKHAAEQGVVQEEVAKVEEPAEEIQEVKRNRRYRCS